MQCVVENIVFPLKSVEKSTILAKLHVAQANPAVLMVPNNLFPLSLAESRAEIKTGCLKRGVSRRRGNFFLFH